MTPPVLSRYFRPEHGEGLGVRFGAVVHDVTDTIPNIRTWLNLSEGRVEDAIADLILLAEDSEHVLDASDFDNAPSEDSTHWLAPVDPQMDIWASGVTYVRSREARQEEAVDGGDVYARVYEAERPELFFKAHGGAVVGPYGDVGIRADASWSVPEPELALIINPAMELVGFTIGNDMSSRDIEGENPLYLPQAKVYNRSCSMGQGIVLRPSENWPPLTINIQITRNRRVAFSGEIHTSSIKRSIGELIDYLGRSYDFPFGAALLSGTGIVPPADFTLAAGDVIDIEIENIGKLSNPVVVV